MAQLAAGDPAAVEETSARNPAVVGQASTGDPAVVEETYE
jgi:hypothetical protein